MSKVIDNKDVFGDELGDISDTDSDAKSDQKSESHHQASVRPKFFILPKHSLLNLKTPRIMMRTMTKVTIK